MTNCRWSAAARCSRTSVEGPRAVMRSPVALDANDEVFENYGWANFDYYVAHGFAHAEPFPDDAVVARPRCLDDLAGDRRRLVATALGAGAAPLLWRPYLPRDVAATRLRATIPAVSSVVDVWARGRDASLLVAVLLELPEDACERVAAEAAAVTPGREDAAAMARQAAAMARQAAATPREAASTIREAASTTHEATATPREAAATACDVSEAAAATREEEAAASAREAIETAVARIASPPAVKRAWLRLAVLADAEAADCRAAARRDDAADGPAAAAARSWRDATLHLADAVASAYRAEAAAQDAAPPPYA